MGRKLDGNTARIADAVTHPLDQFHMDAVAGRQVTAALGDADNRLAGTQFFRRHTVIHEALQIERRHVEMVRVVEPVLGPQAAHGCLVVAHEIASALFAVVEFFEVKQDAAMVDIRPAIADEIIEFPRHLLGERQGK
ncbi:hypothetical protein D3C80_1143470 [compost metagenome]